MCLHTQGEVRQFDTLRCVIHSRLIWCKNYRNRSIFAKVVAKSFGPHFLCPAVYNKMSAATYPQQTGVVRWKPEAHCCNASYVLVADDSSSIVHCPSHGHILKTKQDRSIVTMEHCQDSVAAFNSSPDAPPPSGKHHGPIWELLTHPHHQHRKWLIWAGTADGSVFYHSDTFHVDSKLQLQISDSNEKLRMINSHTNNWPTNGREIFRPLRGPQNVLAIVAARLLVWS